MTSTELDALEAVRLDWAPVSDEVWMSPVAHVEGMNLGAERILLEGVQDALNSPGPSPLGVAIVGEGGTGKTHQLGWLRHQVQRNAGGYFFLVEINDFDEFWSSTLLSVIEGLTRSGSQPDTQLRTFLSRLIDLVEVTRHLKRQVVGDMPLSRSGLDAFVDALQPDHGQVVMACQDTLRAMIVYSSGALHDRTLAQNFLLGNDEQEAGERTAWGLRRGARDPKLIIRDLFRLLALTGPSVIAFDQLDALLAQAWTLSRAEEIPEQLRQQLTLDHVAAGLMNLRQFTRRTLIVVACLPASWELIQTKAISTVSARFREAGHLQNIPDQETAETLLAKRFASRYASIGFSPDYPTWPVKTAALHDADLYTPRVLLQRVDAHIQRCLDDGRAVELDDLTTVRVGQVTHRRLPPPDDELDQIDRQFERLCDEASTAHAVHPLHEDEMMPMLLSAALHAWIVEQGEKSRHFSVDSPSKGKWTLHARLRRTVNEVTDEQEHWAFRGISTTSPQSVLAKIRNARLDAGLRADSPTRHLILLRQTKWPRSPRNEEARQGFLADGGVSRDIPNEDLSVFAALQKLSEASPTKLNDWLRSRRPASRSSVLSAVLAHASAHADDRTGAPEDRPPPEPPEPLPESSSPASGLDALSIEVGISVDDGNPVSIELESLRKHAVIFAGSGSGKTVLIRRLVEECALRGVSTIILDPNNDLARLGDPWPEPPTSWTEQDRARAAEYISNTDVVVWTPRREAGRPLSFQPLPDFASVLSDADEFGAAVDAAVASLAPRAMVDGANLKAVHGRAVLTEALRSFGRSGLSGIHQFIDYLSLLPEGVSRMNRADKLAEEMAQTLTAATVNDPMFGGGGEPIDPAVLFTPAPGKKARVSVISFVGLPADDQRQGLVNQLQMALFAWIKRHPAGDRPLGGLFIMDEAQTLAPSGALTPCTASTLALASQARKYGLGLVFATQAPKALHNRIPGNASTQFFGRLTAPIQIESAREMAKARGSDVPDIAALPVGEFFASIEDAGTRKIRVPLCLSYHPRSPLTVDEVIDRARKS